MLQHIKRLGLISILLVSLWVMVLPATTWAQEESVEAEENANPRGAGTVILMVGVASIALVGFIYASRLRGENRPQTP
jgi:hypothetical protein